MPMVKTENFLKVEITSSAELRDWLLNHYMQSNSVWLVTYKKHVGSKYVSTSQVLDELLCFGWIDGIRRKLDEDRTMQLISPRKSQHWTNSYKKRYELLLRDNRVHESGMRSVEISKDAGLWDFMKDVDELLIPDDLLRELRRIENAEQFFNKFAPSVRRFTLRWLKLSKTEKTRNKRVELVASLAAKGEKIPGL